MNRNQNIYRSDTSETAPRAARLWQRPAVIRLEAGEAEAGFRLISPDGPLSSFS